MDNIMVSVLCLVYNHEKYLRKCLDGFVMQKTDFPFEVIINDDASTDSSATILREYEEKYPDLFHVIYQTENQYSKNVSITGTFLYPASRGKYIAFCEGDDFWSDPLKLQKQVNALESHPDCHMCIHKVVCCEDNGDPVAREYPPFPLESGVLSGHDFLKLFAKRHFVHLCSYLFDADLAKKYYPPLDPENQVVPAPFGDASCGMFFACLGDFYYIDDPMSCHRLESAGGWTIRYNMSSSTAKVSRKEKGISMARQLDEFSGGKHHSEFAEWIFDKECFIADVTGDYRPLLRKENREIMHNTRSLRFRVRVYLSAAFPHVVPKLFNSYFKRKGKTLGRL